MHAIVSEGSESGGIERYKKYRDVLWYSVCRNTTLRNVARNAEVHLCELPATGGQLWPLLLLGVLSGAQHCASYADSVFTGRRGKSQRKTFLWTKKNGPLFRDPFFNTWSGKRDSHLASAPLKYKGFFFLPKQESTQFWTYFRSISRPKN